jgi:hypothetical protein
LEQETLRIATEWYNHIELAGLFAVGTFVVGKILSVLIERFFGAKGCAACPEIKSNQAILRNITLPAIQITLSDLTLKVGIMNTKIDLMMIGLKLTPIKEEDILRAMK